MRICKGCKQPKGLPHLLSCSRRSYLGTWQTRKGYFVRVEKKGIVHLNGKEVEGFLGYEIMQDGRRNGDWIAFDNKGNARDRAWDLMERKINTEGISGSKKFIEWPPERGVESVRPPR